MINYLKNPRKIAKGISILFLVFFIGGIGGVYFDQHILPFIRTNKYLSRINFLNRAAENVTIINNTQQVTIKEDDSINEVASLASNAVVNIVSIVNQKDIVTRENKIENRSGTGVIVTSDGLIVTYRASIIEKDANYKVFLSNGNHYDAKFIGIDEFTDLAFLKIDANNLTTVSLADSSGLHPGKKLIAIGNSFGEYQNRYEAGLLSHINKNFNLGGKAVAVSEKLEGVFEDDLKNQKEYIGGPVVGYSRDMIGIIGMININGQDKYFQIPSNAVRNSISLAVNNELNSRPFFGAYYISITKEFFITNKLNRDRGALIYSPSGKQGLAIISGSPAEVAGIKINDIIVSVNGEEVNLDNPLSNLINKNKKGSQVEFIIDRNGQEIKITAQL